MKVYEGFINFILKLKAIVLLIFRKVICVNQIRLALFSNWVIPHASETSFSKLLFSPGHHSWWTSILAKQSKNFVSPHSIVVFEIITLGTSHNYLQDTNAGFEIQGLICIVGYLF